GAAERGFDRGAVPHHRGGRGRQARARPGDAGRHARWRHGRHGPLSPGRRKTRTRAPFGAPESRLRSRGAMTSRRGIVLLVLLVLIATLLAGCGGGGSSN